jgi:hypothetical protein
LPARERRRGSREWAEILPRLWAFGFLKNPFRSVAASFLAWSLCGEPRSAGNYACKSSRSSSRRTRLWLASPRSKTQSAFGQDAKQPRCPGANGVPPTSESTRRLAVETGNAGIESESAFRLELTVSCQLKLYAHSCKSAYKMRLHRHACDAYPFPWPHPCNCASIARNWNTIRYHFLQATFLAVCHGRELRPGSHAPTKSSN